MSWMDNLPKEHIMTSDEYLVERINNLEKENQELKETIERLKESKRVWVSLDWDRVKGKFQFEYDEKEAKIKYMEVENGSSKD